MPPELDGAGKKRERECFLRGSGCGAAPDLAPGRLIERKQGAPFTANRFWSKSPFTTKEHLFALEEFEKLLAGSNGSNLGAEPELKRAIRLDD
jgi:hypothetical protein